MIYISNKVGWVYENKVLIEAVLTTRKHEKISVFASYFKNYALKNTSVEVIVGNNTKKVKTDNNGNLSVIMDMDKNSVDQIVFRVKGQELHIDFQELWQVTKGDQLVISDIDDTILKSHTLYPLKQLVNTLLPVKDRKMIPNVQKFIVKMKMKGRHIVYVSNSSMNLKNYLLHFMHSNQFPRGPLLLNSYQNLWTLIKDKFKGKKEIIDYKKDRIIRIMNFLDGCEFGLIGDNSQQDPYIFLSLAKKFRGVVDFIAVRKAIIGSSEKIEEAYAKANQSIILFDDQMELQDVVQKAKKVNP